MKNQDRMFYTITALIVGLFAIVPFATGLSIGEDFPLLALCKEWIDAGERFVFGGSIAKFY
ncbi:MAG: hypothetical protein DHS20C12_30650 [Pseudohongiella sp.]|nr:MAG: hypothetical protein DHS20C12_30650 [Pseudohongiella sp.]